MLGATIASLPNLISFHRGGRYSDWDGIAARPFGVGTIVDAKRSLAVFSLGNIVKPFNDTEYEFPSVPAAITVTHYSMTVAVVMTVTGIVIAIGAMWLWSAEAALAARTSWNRYGTVTLEDYTVQVKGIPEAATRKEVHQHFETVRGTTVALIEQRFAPMHSRHVLRFVALVA